MEKVNNDICQLCLEIFSQDCIPFNILCIESHGSICQECLSQYISHKVADAAFGTCPIIYCPFPHSSKLKPIIKYELWSSSGVIKPDFYSKYLKLASSLQSILCGSCHTIKSVDVKITANVSECLTNMKEKVQDLQRLEMLLNQYSSGIISTETLYSELGVLCSTLLLDTDQNAWAVFSLILSMITDPERRASLHLRYIRDRPRVWTSCCNREHCFKCKIKDFHNGTTCDQNIAMFDGTIVKCPGCDLSLVKGDGCDSVTCLCGTCFCWSAELEVNKFLSFFPSNTAYECARVLCEDGSGQSPLRLSASAWRRRNDLQCNAALAEWWQRKYPYCPGAAAALLQRQLRHEQQDAAAQWQARRPLEVTRWEGTRSVARRAVCEAMAVAPAVPAVRAACLRFLQLHGGRTVQPSPPAALFPPEINATNLFFGLAFADWEDDDESDSEELPCGGLFGDEQSQESDSEEVPCGGGGLVLNREQLAMFEGYAGRLRRLLLLGQAGASAPSPVSVEVRSELVTGAAAWEKLAGGKQQAAAAFRRVGHFAYALSAFDKYSNRRRGPLAELRLRYDTLAAADQRLSWRELYQAACWARQQSVPS